jgi:hypothetical protein
VTSRKVSRLIDAIDGLDEYRHYHSAGPTSSDALAAPEDGVRLRRALELTDDGPEKTVPRADARRDRP